MSDAASSTPRDTPWPVAVFAHNEAATIGTCLDCLPAAAAGHAIQVFVLANGCTDDTESIVLDRAASRPEIQLVSLATADKASTWNHYIHHCAPRAPLHFFTDADVLACQQSLAVLADTLGQFPSLNAAGAVPTTGRRRAQWQAKMEARGLLAGNLYALSGSFVERIQRRKVHMPRYLIGEDFLVSFLASTNLFDSVPEDFEGALVAFNRLAGFAFRSLSLWRPADWHLYWRRKLRYSERHLQNRLLFGRLESQGLESMPVDVAQLYRESSPDDLPETTWRPADALFDMLARRRVSRQLGGSA